MAANSYGFTLHVCGKKVNLRIPNPDNAIITSCQYDVHVTAVIEGVDAMTHLHVRHRVK